jgi:hypothetical protein
MTKADLVAKMADSAGITKAAAEKALAGFLGGVTVGREEIPRPAKRLRSRLPRSSNSRPAASSREWSNR